MPITSDDVKLMQSERLTDNDDGGGRMTSNEVIDGQLNNLFTDISRLDRATGRVSLRKAFPWVDTPADDIYLGAHVALINPPDDPSVSVTLFNTEDWYDERVDAQDFVESYVVQGPLYQGILYETQIEGSRAVSLVQRLDSPIPDIGSILLLVEDEGEAGEYSQYVRIVDVSEVVLTFTLANFGNFDRRVVTCEISDPLRYTFHGGTTSNFYYMTHGNAVVRETNVADAAKYYGVSALSEDGIQGMNTVKAESLFAQLVPSVQAESAVHDIGLQSKEIQQPCSSERVVFNVYYSVASNNTYTFYMPHAIVPGSFKYCSTAACYVDKGDGGIAYATNPSGYNGTIDYETGIITVENTTAAIVRFEYIPKTNPLIISDSIRIGIEAQNRGYTYTAILFPLPKPNGLFVDYFSQGRWYRLNDQGNGVLAGSEPEFGAGSIDYSNGNLTITCGSMPDVGSNINIGWSHGDELTVRDTDIEIEAPLIDASLGNNGVLPNSVTLTWPSNSVTKTATDNGTGQFTGDGTGSVDYTTGRILMRPNDLPDPSSLLQADYSAGTQQTVTDTPVKDGGGNISITLTGGPIEPGTVQLSWIGEYSGVQTTHYATDNGSGAILYRDGIDYPQVSVIGSINYSTGVATFNPDVLFDLNQILIDALDPSTGTDTRYWSFTFVGSASSDFVAGSTVTAFYQPASTSWNAESESIAIPDLLFNITPHTQDSIVPGTLVFNLGGDNFYDYSGILYRNRNFSTGSASIAGAVDYETGFATISSYDATAADFDLQSLLTVAGDVTIAEAYFRTPGAPLRPGSLSIQVTAADGATLSATTDFDGNISGTLTEGFVDVSTGSVRVRWGEWVTAAGNEAEDWYSEDEVVGSLVWKPTSVFGSTVRFAAVVYAYLPLDADIIGVDPVRLPSDGRVPIFRPGDVAIVHDTQTETLPDNLVADQVVSLNRGELDLVEVFDQNDVRIPATLYTVDLGDDVTNGSITMANPLDLSAYTEPLYAAHRREDMLLVTDTQINGEITLIGQLTNDYPAASSYVSSTLPFGDLQARVYNIFDQYTWNGTWSDSLDGSAANGTYDDLNYPLQIANDGATSERWAIKFTSSVAFEVHGENLGVIATGDTSTDLAPINPATGNPYFTILAAGWGAGWITGNALRFNTDSANHPLWICRTTKQGPVVEPEDEFVIQIRGDSE